MEPNRWKTLARSEVFKHPRKTLVEDTVQLPSGAVMAYLRRPPGAAGGVTVIATNSKQQLLVQREYSYPPNEVLWQLPGGGIEPGEDPVTAGRRELREESGLDATTVRELGWFYPNNRHTDARMHVLLCQDLYEVPATPDDAEFITSSWLNPHQMDELIAAGHITNIYMLAALHLWQHRS